MEYLTNNQNYLYSFTPSSLGKGKTETIKKDEIIFALIADDHPYLIQGVEIDLNKDPRIKILGTCDSYDKLLLHASKLRPNIILLDLRMPGCEKYDLKDYISKLKNLCNCKVIIFSNETGWARIHRCLDFGASAYIEKAISLGRLPELIRRVYENNEVLIYTAEKLPEISFSDRQKEILHHIADGKENNQIGNIMNIELKTVQSYLHKIKAKLEEAFIVHPVKPRTLIILAQKLGFGTKVA